MPANFELAAKPIQSKITSCDDRLDLWKTDHDFAMMVFDCQELVEDMIECFQSIDRLSRKHIDSLRSGCLEYDPGFEAKMKKLMADWTDLANEINSELVPSIEKCGHVVDHAAELRVLISEAEESKILDYESYAMEVATSVKIPLESVPSFDPNVDAWPEY